MDRAELLSRFDGLNLWRRGSQRAPHKPLLVLYALARLSRGERGPVPFREVDPALTELLREFGPSRQSYHPEYPFWRLQNDGVWTVNAPEHLRLRVSNTDPPKSELLKHDVSAAFSTEVRQRFERDPALVSDVATRLLDAHFPETMHADILAAVGLDSAQDAERGDGADSKRRPRDPKFRPRVLTAYEHRCAVCDFDLKLGPASLALDAAHIQWHQAAGPDEVANGLALCTLHHKVFDLGAFTIEPDDLVLLVSDQVHGAFGRENLIDRHAQPVRPPQRPDDRPDAQRLAWHRHEVFKGEPRHVA